jgi:RNase P subunit RPR2
MTTVCAWCNRHMHGNGAVISHGICADCSTTVMADCPPHHWRVRSPDGPHVDALCLRCGMRRTYRTTDERDYNQWAREQGTGGWR